MNKRSKKPPVTPAEGPCPEGLKAFDVTVVETFNHHYIVYAKDERAAEEIVEGKCNNDEFSPSTEGDSEFDRSVDAEETELRVMDLKPETYIRWKRRKYPLWKLWKDRRFALVGSVDLQKVLYDEDDLSKVSDPKARAVDLEIAFYVGPEDTVADIVKEIFG